MPVPGLSLVGFMERQAALEYLRETCVLDDESDEALCGIWESARARLGSPMERAGKPHIEDIPRQNLPYLKALQNTEHFKGAVDDFPWRFGCVEMAPLLAYQSHVSLQAHRDVQRRKNTDRDILERCLPVSVSSIQYECRITDSPIQCVIEATSNDLNLVMHRLSGLPLTPTGFILAPSNPLVQVARFEGRYYLKNGYHRAVQLLAVGRKVIPCIILDVARVIDTGIRPGTFTVEQSRSLNPPTCGHLTGQRAWAVQLRRARRRVTLTASMTVDYLD